MNKFFHFNNFIIIESISNVNCKTYTKILWLKFIIVYETYKKLNHPLQDKGYSRVLGYFFCHEKFIKLVILIILKIN